MQKSISANGHQPDKLVTQHTAYYSGKDVTTNMPTAGTAEYSVKGISQYNGGALAAGTLTANFGTKSLAGNIGSTNINATINNNATFAGAATLMVNQAQQMGTSLATKLNILQGN